MLTETWRWKSTYYQKKRPGSILTYTENEAINLLLSHDYVFKIILKRSDVLSRLIFTEVIEICPLICCPYPGARLSLNP